MRYTKEDDQRKHFDELPIHTKLLSYSEIMSKLYDIKCHIASVLRKFTQAFKTVAF